MAVTSWDDLLASATPFIQAAADRMKAAETHAPKALSDVYQVFTAHEQALVDYMQLESTSADGADVLRAFINRVRSLQQTELTPAE